MLVAIRGYSVGPGGGRVKQWRIDPQRYLLSPPPNSRDSLPRWDPGRAAEVRRWGACVRLLEVWDGLVHTVGHRDPCSQHSPCGRRTHTRAPPVTCLVTTRSTRVSSAATR